MALYEIKANGHLGRFCFRLNSDALRLNFKKMAISMQNSFISGILNPPKTGRKYSHLPNRSSASGEFPANQTGALARSVRSSYSDMFVTIGSNKYYSRFLAYGRRNMGPRKMSKEVLQMTEKTFPKFIKISKFR